MKTRNVHIYCLLLSFLLMLASVFVHAQYEVKGSVYDSSRLYPLEAVTVMSTSGKGALTDINGNYRIEVGEKDSIWFSYLGKPTIKFAVLKMIDPQHFDLSLQVNVTVLKGVDVRPRNYRIDSLQNRIDYAKIFNYEKPKLRPTMGGGPGGVGVGFDIDAIIQMFQFRKNKNMLRFQERLVEQEHDKYVDHRFSKQLIRRLTNLPDSQLDNFMIIYRPTYEFTIATSDYDFQTYIKNCYEHFKVSEAKKEKAF